VERGDWDGSSFGFRAEQDEWNLNANPRERRLLDLTMRDIGPVTFPAYLETSSHATGAMRSLANHLGCEVRDVEQAFQTDVLGSLFEQAKPAGEERERIVLGGGSGRSNTHTDESDVTVEATETLDDTLDEAARNVAAAVESRAGKVLSQKTVGTITAAMDMLQQLLADASGTDGTDTVPGPKAPGDLNDDGDIDPPLERALTDAEVEARLNALRLRRYSPAEIAA
jgi:hypothetical protein